MATLKMEILTFWDWQNHENSRKLEFWIKQGPFKHNFANQPNIFLFSKFLERDLETPLWGVMLLNLFNWNYCFKIFNMLLIWRLFCELIEIKFWLILLGQTLAAFHYLRYNTKKNVTSDVDMFVVWEWMISSHKPK